MAGRWIPVNSAENSAVQSTSISPDGQHMITGEEKDIQWSHDGGATWSSKTIGYSNLYSVKISSDGQHMIVAEYLGIVFWSHDGGATWEKTSIHNVVYSVAMSDDGQHMMASSVGWQIYWSHDGGNTWLHHATNAGVESVDISDDGQHMIASTGNYHHQLFWSHDGGTTWSDKDLTRITHWVSISNNGQHMIAGSWDHKIWWSKNGGTTWSTHSTGGLVYTTAISPDGQHLIAGAYDKKIYWSHDGGSTWSNYATSGDIRSVELSTDGQHLIAGSTDHNIYWSNDGGATWSNHVTGDEVQGVSISDDGQHMLAGSNDHKVYVYRVVTIQTITDDPSDPILKPVHLTYNDGEISFTPYTSAEYTTTISEYSDDGTTWTTVDGAHPAPADLNGKFIKITATVSDPTKFKFASTIQGVSADQHSVTWQVGTKVDFKHGTFTSITFDNTVWATLAHDLETGVDGKGFMNMPISDIGEISTGGTNGAYSNGDTPNLSLKLYSIYLKGGKYYKTEIDAIAGTPEIDFTKMLDGTTPNTGGKPTWDGPHLVKDLDNNKYVNLVSGDNVIINVIPYSYTITNLSAPKDYCKVITNDGLVVKEFYDVDQKIADKYFTTDKISNLVVGKTSAITEELFGGLTVKGWYELENIHGNNVIKTAIELPYTKAEYQEMTVAQLSEVNHLLDDIQKNWTQKLIDERPTIDELVKDDNALDKLKAALAARP